MKFQKNIVLIGMPGSGKSVIGKSLAKKLCRTFVDCDEEIAKLTDMTIPQIFEQHGEEYFRAVETKVLGLLTRRKGVVLSTGGGAVTRAENMALCKKNGIVVFINRPVSNILKNASIRNRPLIKDENPQKKLDKLYSERIELYKKYCDIEILNDDTVSNIVNKITEEAVQ